MLMDVNGKNLLFDSGAGTIGRLMEAGLSISDVDYIFYSHLHPDHTGELVSFMFSSKHGRRIERSKPLTIVAGKGFSAFFGGLKKVYGKWIELPNDLFCIKEMSVSGFDSMKIDQIEIKTAPMNHSPESIGFRVTDNVGKSAVYSGDTDYSTELEKLAIGADVLICDSSMPDGMKHDGHLTPSLAGEIAGNANVKKLVLTHLNPECDEVDMVAQCCRIFSGDVVLAYDLMEIKI